MDRDESPSKHLDGRVIQVFDRGGLTLYRGDCRELLSEVIADVVIADPPYGDTSLGWDRQVQGWPAEVQLTDQGSLWCFGSLRSFMRCGDEFAGWKFAQDIIWRKHNGSNFHADRFRRVHEHVAQFYRGAWADIYKAPVTTPDATPRAVRRKTRPPHTGHIEASSYVSEDGGPRLQRSVIDVRSCHGYAIHPTEKPLGILDPLLRYSCLPGGLVLDPFAGSASTLEAAFHLGLDAIGVEVDERYCELAGARLSALVDAVQIGEVA